MNARDVDAIGNILADDCRLVDSTGGWVEGRQNALAATRNFFEYETEFRLDDVEIVLHGEEVLVRGNAFATDPNIASDKLWRAKVKDGKLAYWQSFGDKAVPLARMLLPEQAGVSQKDSGARL